MKSLHNLTVPIAELNSGVLCVYHFRDRAFHTLSLQTCTFSCCEGMCHYILDFYTHIQPLEIADVICRCPIETFCAAL